MNNSPFRSRELNTFYARYCCSMVKKISVGTSTLTVLTAVVLEKLTICESNGVQSSEGVSQVAGPLQTLRWPCHSTLLPLPLILSFFLITFSSRDPYV